MAIKCMHSDHSSAEEQHKYQKIQAEEAQECKAAKPQDTHNLVHVKHDWFDKGDTVVIHLYVKNVNKQLLDVVLYEDELHVKFATSNNEFLKMYPGTSENTLFSWNLKLRGNVEIAESNSRVAIAFVQVSLKKKSPARWNGLEKVKIPGQKGDSALLSDRPFKQLFKPTETSQVSQSREKMTNGVHETASNTDNSEITCSKESKNFTKENASNLKVKEEIIVTTPEEKLLPNGVSESSAVEDPCDACGSSDMETMNSQFTTDCIPQDIDGDDMSVTCNLKTPLEYKPETKFSETRTTSTCDESANGHVNLETPIESSGMEKDCDYQAQHATATSTAESLTTSFSTLSTTVQPSTSTSTLPSVSSFDSASASVSQTAIPLPPPTPPPPPPAPHLSEVRGCGDGQAKTGVMGGSKSSVTHLPFSDAIKAAASKGADAVEGSFYEEEDSDECVHIGLTGLDNLGNTCYLNSIIQCLANTRQLRDFFLGDEYKDDINTENPLGTGGKLAVSFVNLMRNLWSGKDRSLSPYKLKGIVGEKVCQFKGYMQQDAQEFMAFLLDGLHEDLNRIKEKPYVEEVEGAGKPDAEVANEAWRRYKSRNDSVIVDLFQGQLKSKLTCPMCNKISIKYDPFMNLSVPLPKEQKLLPVYVFFKDYNRVPLKIRVKVTQDANVEQLTAAVERITGIQVENMRVYEVFHGKFHRAFDRGCSLSSVAPNDITVVYEVLSEEEAGEQVYEVPIIQRTVCPRVVPGHCASCYKRPRPGEVLRRCTQCWGIGYCNQDCQKDHWATHKKSCKRVPQPIGTPFILSVPASKATFKQLQKMAEEYAKYSVTVQPGDTVQANSSTTGETSSEENTASGVTCVVGPPKGSFPKFYIKPVTVYGDAVTGQEGNRLSEEGTEPLELEGKFLSIDWRNHPRSQEFVDVDEKVLECEEHPSCKSETVTESYSCSLKECLELFTEPETLSENDAWYCPECKAHREATKQLSVWRLPEILIIHLKRFSFRNILFKDKITKLVEFPLRGLDMSRFTLGKDDKEGSLYDLFAVANHSGTVNFGHYTAFGRLAEADQPIDGLKKDGFGWRYFDDRHVTETSEERIVSKYAYVLFYKRRPTITDLVNPVVSLKQTQQATETTKASLEDVDENELD
ncbi:ubiquitin carboxyl-terminal hydrolase 19-like isoform X3 [Oculina patagonica]